MASSVPPSRPPTPPLTPGLLPNLRFDALSGFLVFLIALPLCLGVAAASQFPPIAGVWTAVIGGVLATFISNSQLTIKGPAAGLIVVVATSVATLGEQAAPQYTADQIAELRKLGKTDADVKAMVADRQAEQLRTGYPLALGCALVAGVIQILFGLLRLGSLGELVPPTPVHGVLAAIGIAVMAKQSFPVLGIPGPDPGLTPAGVIALIPAGLARINWAVAAVGLVSLGILVAFPYARAAAKALDRVPAQVVVLAAAIPLAAALDLPEVGRRIREATGKPFAATVSVPNLLADPPAQLPKAFTRPDFSAVATGPGVVAVMMFSLIASIESLLGSQAIDMIDPWRRKTDQNRELLATGVCNTLCAAVGALPMVSEVVRSKANVDNGARTKYADMFHGLCLFAFVLLLPSVINLIPAAALGAMLVAVGFRLAAPREFVRAYRIGAEQLVVFVATVAVTLGTDLLTGVASGVALEAAIHLANGAPVGSFFRPTVVVAERDGGGPAAVQVRRAAVFSNWLGLRAAILAEAEGRSEVVVDLSQARLVDHGTMGRLYELEKSLAEAGKKLTVTGLDSHRALSAHPLAARKSSCVAAASGATVGAA